jgi:glycosyltransferase involved in cell wall biosynthesis
MISIVIPTYNEEKYLPLLLKSIKRQKFKDYEIIVADNNSKDMTRKISSDYGCKVVDGGLPSKARNNGAKYAKGGIILFLDADVILTRNYLEKSVKDFKKRNIDVAISGIRAKSDKGIDKFLYLATDIFLKSAQYFKALGSACCGIMVRASLHRKIGGFNEKIKFAEDSDYLIRANEHGKFRILKSHLFVSPRRLEVEGRLNTSLKYVKSTYCDIVGKYNRNVNYKFGIYNLKCKEIKKKKNKFLRKARKKNKN